MTSRKTIILSIAILYGLLSFLLLSETFIMHLLEVKRDFHIKQSQNLKEITFLKEEWNKLANKKEFKLAGAYYDVKKIKSGSKKVQVLVVKDEYENAIKYISKNISPKNKKSKALKNKNTYDVCLHPPFLKQPLFVYQNVQNNFPPVKDFKSTAPKKGFRPPCI